MYIVDRLGSVVPSPGGVQYINLVQTFVAREPVVTHDVTVLATAQYAFVLGDVAT